MPTHITALYIQYVQIHIQNVQKDQKHDPSNSADMISAQSHITKLSEAGVEL